MFFDSGPNTRTTNPRRRTAAIFKTVELQYLDPCSGSTNCHAIWHGDAHCPTELAILPNKPATIIKQTKLASVSLHCKCRHLKTANIKILSANSKHRFCIYDRMLTDINVIASFCALNLQIKFWYLPY